MVTVLCLSTNYGEGEKEEGTERGGEEIVVGRKRCREGGRR